MASNDAEVIRLRVESLKLVVQAEVLLERLEDHQQSLASFLEARRRQTGRTDSD